MKGVRLKALGVALLGAFALLFGGCGQQGGGGGQKGTLTVNVSPGDAQVQVTGPGNFSQTFTGSKTLTGLNPGSYTVEASKSGYFSAQATHEVEAGKTTTAVLSLIPVPAAQPTEGKVAVLVVNGNGQPIAGATVSDGSQSATTDAQGRADLTYTQAGAYAISVNASGYLGDAKLASVELGKTAALTFRLQPVPPAAPTTGTLVVHVYGEDTGQTLAGSSVASSPALTFSGSGGLFTATAAPGTYAVTASASGYLDGSRAVNVVAGQTSVLNIGLRRNTASGPVGEIQIVSVKDQWGVDLPVQPERNEAKAVNLYASQTEEPVCVTVRVTRNGQPVVGARVRVSAVSYGDYSQHAALLYKGCETQNVTELDFVETDANGIAKFSFQGIGNYEEYGALVKFLVSASEQGSGWTARSQEFKVFFYNITHLYLDGRLSSRRTGHDFGQILNAFDFDRRERNRHLFRAEVRRKQPTSELESIRSWGYVRYELVGGDVGKVNLCLVGSNCTTNAPVNDIAGNGVYVEPKANVGAQDLPLSVRVKATLYVTPRYGDTTYNFPLKDFTFTKTWTGAALAIEKTGPSVIGWSGLNLEPDDVTLVQSGANVPAGARYTYTITVRNLSATETARNVVITDPLPAELGFLSASQGGTYDPVLHQVTWDNTTTPALTSIAPGGSVSVTVTVYARHKPGYVWDDNDRDGQQDNLNPRVGDSGYFWRDRPPITQVQTPHSDPYTIVNPALARGDNTPEVRTGKTIHVVRPFFEVQKSPNTAIVFQGERVRFTLTVRNVDRATIDDSDYQALKASFPADYQAALTGYNVVLRDLFGAGLDFVNASPAGTLDANAKTVRWNLGDLPLGGTREVILDLRASEEGEWRNCARLYANNLNQQRQVNGYPRYNVEPPQFEEPGINDPRPNPPYDPLETDNPDSVGNYLQSCATVIVEPRPTDFALGISSLGEFDSLVGGNPTDPVVQGSDYYYRFDVRAWEGSTGPQTNVTLTVTRTAGNSTFPTGAVKGVDYEVLLSTDGGATFSPVLAANVTATLGVNALTITYNAPLGPGHILRYSLRATAVDSGPTTVRADASSAEYPGPVTVFETTTIIP